MWVSLCHRARAEVTGQLLGAGSLSPPHAAHISSLGPESSHWPLELFGDVSIFVSIPYLADGMSFTSQKIVL